MNLTLPKRNILEKVYPRDAVAISQNSGVSGSYSTWVQVVAATTGEFTLCGSVLVYHFNEATANFTDDVFLHQQIGIGAAASEIPIGQIVTASSIAYTDQNPSSADISFCFYYPIQPVVIPSGTRLAIRHASSSTHLIITGTYLIGYDTTDGYPLPKYFDTERYIRGIDLNIGTRLTSLSTRSFAYPDASSTTVTAGGSTWTVGSWVEFIASASNDILITGLTNNTTGSTTRHAVAEIGIGASGFEEAVAAVALPGIAGRLGPSPGLKRLVRPLYVRKGERVVVRLKGSSASMAINIVLTGDELL